MKTQPVSLETAIETLREVSRGGMTGLMRLRERSCSCPIGDPNRALLALESFKELVRLLTTGICILAAVGAYLAYQAHSTKAWVCFVLALLLTTGASISYAKWTLGRAKNLADFMQRFARAFIPSTWRSEELLEERRVEDRILILMLELQHLIHYAGNSKVALLHLMNLRLVIAGELRLPNDPALYEWVVGQQSKNHDAHVQLDSDAALKKLREAMGERV